LAFAAFIISPSRLIPSMGSTDGIDENATAYRRAATTPAETSDPLLLTRRTPKFVLAILTSSRLEQQMQVLIKDFAVEMSVRNKGVEFQVHDNAGKFIGDCYVTKTGLIWCAGKTTRQKGITVSWDRFVKLMEKNG
jgi:hypothetical protein